MAVKRVAGRLARKFAKKLSAKQLAASRRNIKKAIAASARKRGKAIAGVARNPVKAYGRSVVRRSAKRKAKVLSKIAKRQSINNTTLTNIGGDITKYSRSTAILKGKNVGLSESIKKTGQQYLKLNVKRDAAGNLVPGKNNMFTRRALRKVLNENERLVKQYNTNATLIGFNRSLVSQLEGKQADLLNLKDNLAGQYAKMSAKSLSYRVGTVARDVTTTAAAGATTYMGYQEYKRQRAKRK